MDYWTLLLLLPMIWACLYILTSTSSRRQSCTTKLPPGPYPLPIIGNIFQLGSKPHQSLANLSKTYGSFMSLKLGSITTIVISSPTLAKQVLQIHDLAFSSRTIPDSGYALDHNQAGLVWLPVGNQWRKLRKLCKEHIFASHLLDGSQGLRKKVVAEMLEYVAECGISGEAIDIGRVAFTTSLNLLSNFIFSIDLAHYHSASSQEFKDIIWALMELAAKPNFADYFPLLKWFDPQGVRQETEIYVDKLLRIFDGIVDERLATSGNSCNDVLNSLLNLNEKSDSGLSRNQLRHLFLDLFVAGTDTTSSTVEWAMAELIRNPEIMVKARSELKQVIGNDGVVEESDIARLPYLQAIVKETFRLHPAAPFLVPHKSELDVEIEGFMVPKNAQILTNVWAIGRDSSVWLNPESFMPERFIDSDIEFKGHHFELIPFGSGRRICPGLSLAVKMVHLMVGSLLYSSDWKIEGEMNGEDIDMSDKFGITLQKAVPLKLIPISP